MQRRAAIERRADQDSRYITVHCDSSLRRISPQLDKLWQRWHIQASDRVCVSRRVKVYLGRYYVAGDHHHAHLAKSIDIRSNVAQRIDRETRTGAIRHTRHGSGSGGSGSSSLSHFAARTQWLSAQLPDIALISCHQWRYAAHRLPLRRSGDVLERLPCRPCGSCGPRCSRRASGHLSQQWFTATATTLPAHRGRKW